MTPAVATRPKRSRELRGFGSAREMREVLGALLEEVNGDGRIGPQLRAADLSLGVHCPDVRCWLRVFAAQSPDDDIEWSFARGGATPRLRLRMASEVANAWLQGRESVPLAIARGRMRCSGDARDVLRYLPALKLLSDPYTELVRAQYPHLALEG